MNQFNVVLICRNSAGAPCAYPARIACTMEQHEGVEYVDDLCEQAEKDGFLIEYEIPIIVNPGDPLWEPFTYVYDDADWANAPLIAIV
jgi:hypothetical protein